MKYRHGFISNSSSTSFVVSVPKGKTKFQIVQEIDLEDVSCETGIDVLDNIYPYKEARDKLEHDVNEELDRGNQVYLIRVDREADDDDSSILLNIIHSKNNQVKVIYEQDE